MKRGIHWTVLVGIGVGLLGILVPIFWDLYKGSIRVEIQQIARDVIISKPEEFRDLKVYYKDEELNTLVRTRYLLINLGRTPILGNTVVSPIKIVFEDSTRIIEARIENQMPPDADMGFSLLPGAKSIVVDFKLLNPRDRVELSVLTAGDAVVNYIGGRIPKVEKIYFRDRTGELKVPTQKLPPSVVIAGIITFVTVAGFMTTVSEGRKNALFRSKYLTSSMDLPGFTSYTELKLFLKRSLSHLTYDQLRPILDMIDIAREKGPIDEQLVDQVRRELVAITGDNSVRKAAYIFGILAAIGVLYVGIRIYSHYTGYALL